MALGDAYASADELRTEFGIGDFDDDSVIESAVTAATAWVTSYCGRDFNDAETATARRFHAPGHCQIVEVDDFSTTSGLVVKTDPGGDGTFETTLTSSGYQAEPFNGIVSGMTGWPFTRIRFIDSYVYPASTHRPVLEVTAQWGWAAIPEPVKRATLIMAARLYKRRDSAEGVLSGFGDFGPVRVGTRIDPDVEALLSPYRKHPILVG